MTAISYRVADQVIVSQMWDDAYYKYMWGIKNLKFEYCSTGNVVLIQLTLVLICY